jgi:hypothetical protein
MKAPIPTSLLPLLLAVSSHASFNVGFSLNNPFGGSYAEFVAQSDNSCCMVLSGRGITSRNADFPVI